MRVKLHSNTGNPTYSFCRCNWQQVMSSISQTKVPLVNIFFGNMIRLNKFPSWLSQNWIFCESPNDRTTCPVIHRFPRTMLNSDRTLSVDRPLFQALNILLESPPLNLYTCSYPTALGDCCWWKFLNTWFLKVIMQLHVEKGCKIKLQFHVSGINLMVSNLLQSIHCSQFRRVFWCIEKIL